LFLEILLAWNTPGLENIPGSVQLLIEYLELTQRRLIHVPKPFESSNLGLITTSDKTSWVLMEHPSSREGDKAVQPCAMIYLSM